MKELTTSELLKIGNLSEENAKLWFKEAEKIAHDGSFGHAYALLILALEEGVKSQICRFYDNFITLEQIAKKEGLSPPNIRITDAKLDKMFKDHKSKRLTVAAQLMLPLIIVHAPGFREEEIQKASEAIEKNKPELSPEVQRLSRLLVEINRNRDISMYVEKDGKNPKNISKEQFEELKKLVADYLENKMKMFLARGDIDYANFEDKIKKIITL